MEHQWEEFDRVFDLEEGVEGIPQL